MCCRYYSFYYHAIAAHPKLIDHPPYLGLAWGFDNYGHYIHLEDDKNSTFKKITEANDWVKSIEFSIDADTKNYENSVITSKSPLRFTYFNLAENFIDKINDSYLNSKPKKFMWVVEDLISKIIQNGPSLKMEIKQFKKLQ